MTRTPAFGEVWLAPDGTLLPGGMLCLIVSSEPYNTEHDQRIVVEVVGDTLASAGALLVDLEPVGSAVIDTPLTVSSGWFAGSTEPIAILHPDKAREVADALRDLLGP